MQKKKIKYCNFCGSELPLEIYTDEYVTSLRNEIKHLEDVVANKIGAKYLTAKDIETLLRGYIKVRGYDYVERQLEVVKWEIAVENKNNIV